MFIKNVYILLLVYLIVHPQINKKKYPHGADGRSLYDLCTKKNTVMVTFKAVGQKHLCFQFSEPLDLFIEYATLRGEIIYVIII